MPFVISKLSADTEFVQYDNIANGNELRNAESRKVLIKGGNRVMEHGTFTTPDNGVITEITKDEANFLMTLPAFMAQLESGFVKILNNKNDQEKSSKDMQIDDGGAQLTEDDFTEENGFADRTEIKINGRKVSESSEKTLKSRKRK